MLTSHSGTYALILRSYGKRRIQVGSWGWLGVKKGYYIYVGSAFGPGGLGARVGRHCRNSKRLHWHLDYLRAAVNPTGVWISHDRERLEHRWARALGAERTMRSIGGFGSSDCRCVGHLFFTRGKPRSAVLRKALKRRVVYESLADPR